MRTNKKKTLKNEYKILNKLLEFQEEWTLEQCQRPLDKKRISKGII